MEGEEPQYVESVVQQDGKIIFLGPKSEALKSYKNATLVDLEGKTLLPAFLDGHGHFYSVGLTAMYGNVLPPPDGPGADFNSIIETMNKYKETEEAKYILNKLGWIMGNGYDDSQLMEKDHPKASDLDKISTEYPVILVHKSGHLACVNTKGLEMIGYTSETPNPEGGVIRRDDNGNPNGVLEEAAFFHALLPSCRKNGC